MRERARIGTAVTFQGATEISHMGAGWLCHTALPPCLPRYTKAIAVHPEDPHKSRAYPGGMGDDVCVRL